MSSPRIKFFQGDIIVIDPLSNNHGKLAVMGISEYTDNLDASHIVLVLS